MKYIEGSSGKPFFLTVSFTSPHDPRTPPREWEEAANTVALSLPPNLMRSPAFDNGELSIRDEQLIRTPRDSSTMTAEW